MPPLLAPSHCAARLAAGVRYGMVRRISAAAEGPGQTGISGRDLLGVQEYLVGRRRSVCSDLSDVRSFQYVLATHARRMIQGLSSSLTECGIAGRTVLPSKRKFTWPTDSRVKVVSVTRRSSIA